MTSDQSTKGVSFILYGGSGVSLCLLSGEPVFFRSSYSCSRVMGALQETTGVWPAGLLTHLNGEVLLERLKMHWAVAAGGGEPDTEV